ncbi:hypothetical protein Q5424_01875 [Conexibacter sp. JD483]|uniref:hypothetical protein n=1 Tax=unclassified Conexibacter TaxID=2627773 RepID=UPI002724E475|nr:MULTISPECIES: hypothetical protein [unclassified Conexibacter]MDO8185185.1 hypothetical protein [Conexibacter sp. CPCC 205706]MDO8198231.1 hypothetical protein [Conexibacter sp. CPCC 205762]MDR9367807.1 hypothetical protein [Conexibacter sp. JD483]
MSVLARSRAALLALGTLAVLPAGAPGAGAAPAGDAPAARAAATRAPKPVSCATRTVTVTSGRSATLALDCRASGRLVVRGRAKRGAAAIRSIVAKPRHGRLVRLDRRSGTVRYVPSAGFRGSDRLSFAIVQGRRRYRGTISLRVLAAPTRPGLTRPEPVPTAPAPALPEARAPTPADPGPGEPQGDGLPPQLPPAPNSYAAANWTPTVYDSCPASVHERYSVIGPDGKRYPTWHPPTTTDPATGRRCTFGHEHGRDPHGSDIFGWVADHLANAGAREYAGIAFGLATESLDSYAAANPGTRIRHEDHVGYKVDYENDVRLLSAGGVDLSVTCDYLVSVHQGSHSPDALSNNVHELLYAVRCDDGTELIADTISRFGQPGRYVRSCDTATSVTTTDNGYPSGGGRREIPDRACVEQTVLVPAGRTTSAWALYEKWSAVNELRTADGHTLATFDPAFGVFDPSRYGDPSASARLGRTLDLCWEVEPNGDRAASTLCDRATSGGALPAAYAYNDPRSPFRGVHRDVYLRETRLDNASGGRLVWTDPYGGRASSTPFPGALCQLVATVDTSDRPALQERVYGRNRPNADEGVHAPN